MFVNVCPLCRDEWLILTLKGLCPECEKIRFIMASYSRLKVIEVLDKIFLIEKFKEEDENEGKEGYEKVNGKWIKHEVK